MRRTADVSRAAASPGDAVVSLHLATSSLFACGLLALGMVLAPASSASGEKFDLMQTLIAEDATLNNNLNPIEPRWERSAEGRTLGLGFSIEKMLSPRLDVQIGGQWMRLSPRDGQSRAGFGNIDMELKYVFLEIPDFQFALVPQLSFPTSSHVGNETMHVQSGALLSWGGRLGDMVEQRGWPRFLQAVELQGDLGYSHTFGSRGNDEILFDPVIDYSLPYLANATGSPAQWPLRNLCAFSELNLSQPLRRGPLSMFATPGAAYLTETYQVTVGIQLPLTHAAEKNQQIAVVGAVMIFMDQIDPRFSWMPF